MNRLVMGISAAIFLIVGLAFGVLALASLRQNYSISIAGFFGPGQKPAAPSVPVPAPTQVSGWMTEYTLTERSGHKFHSRNLKGKVHVANFFFTACPSGVCKLQTAAVQSVAKEFGPQGVTFVSITCDPENDHPAALTLYARQFNADPKQWLFLTGELPYLRRVGAEVYFLVVDHLTHSEALVVVDGEGKIRGRFNWKQAESLADMKKLLSDLLADQGASAP